MSTPAAPRERLLALFANCRATTRDFAASRADHERPAQDLLALIGFWMDYNIERLGYFARGEQAPRGVDFDALTQASIAINAHRTWNGSLAYADAAFDRFSAAITASPDAVLLANNTYDDDPGGPAWGEVMANGFTWPMQEMEKYYQAHSEPERAAALHAALVAEIGEETPIVVPLAAPETLAAPNAAPLVIDVRGAAEYAAGHIPRARNIPLAALPGRLGELPRAGRIVTYCDMRHPGHSRGEQAAVLLGGAGFDAAALAGGLTAWREQGHPIAQGVE